MSMSQITVTDRSSYVKQAGKRDFSFAGLREMHAF